jgi:hypothetical protein
MANRGSVGTAPIPPKAEKSWGYLQSQRENWLAQEIQDKTVPLADKVTGHSFLSWFVIGFGNLIDIFPVRKHREIPGPEKTIKQDAQESWREIGHALCKVTCEQDQPSLQVK